MLKLQKYFILCLVTCLTNFAWSQTTEDQGEVLFRYIDDAGGKVIHQSIPASMVHRGYEIISISGHVLKVVPPAPKGSDVKLMIEKMHREAELAQWDAKLNRRYSEIRDIESAKERSVRELQGTLSLLEVNFEGIKGQIEKQETQVAIAERNAKPVAKVLLQNLKLLGAEKDDISTQILQRAGEINKVSEGYDRDIERFRLIDK